MCGGSGGSVIGGPSSCTPHGRRSLDLGDTKGGARAERIVNFDERTAHWVKLTATQDGPFTITNGRTGVTKAYVSTAKQ
jgi:hypothetical protein